MRIKLKRMIIMFFIIYIFVWNLANAKEPKLNCEAFVKEEICNMTDEEQEKWFWELFRSLIEEEKQEIVETIEV